MDERGTNLVRTSSNHYPVIPFRFWVWFLALVLSLCVIPHARSQSLSAPALRSDIFRRGPGGADVLRNWSQGGSNLPATCDINDIWLLTSAPVNEQFHICTSPDTWTKFTGAGSASGPGGKVFTDAASEASAVVISDTSSLANRLALWCEDGKCTIKCTLNNNEPCPPQIVISSGTVFEILHGGVLMWRINPEAGSRHDMWSFSTAYAPLYSGEVVLHPLGNCSGAQEAIVTGASEEYWTTCSDTTDDGVSFNFTATTKLASNLTGQLTLYAVNTNTAASGTYTLSCAAQSVRPGIDVPQAHNTSGAGNASFVFSNSNASCTASTAPFACCTGSGTGTCPSRLVQASSNFTINGTVGVGARIMGTCLVTAVPGQIADVRLLGMGVLELTGDSLSD